jgi:cell division transport system permease protein
MNDDVDAVTAAPQPGALPQFVTPIVPKGTIAGRALVAIVAIMTFLASLTTGAVVLVRAAASDWQSEVAREVTIQVRPVGNRDLEADVGRAADIARRFAGVADVRVYSKEESSHLLEPWLGTGLVLEELPVPRLAVVRITSGAAPEFQQLARLLAEQVPSASLDDHRGFVEHMRSMGRAAFLGGLAVLALVLIATVLSVTFATRGAIATNRTVVEVLHLIGAKNTFIAQHFQRRFLGLGLQGGVIGGGSALVLFGLIEFASRHFIGNAAGEQFGALFGSFSIGIFGYVAVALQIALIAGVTALASRRTVNRTLETFE